jgi:leader peptidase (prepilin peptidase)/N-methyltransferase
MEDAADADEGGSRRRTRRSLLLPRHSRHDGRLFGDRPIQHGSAAVAGLGAGLPPDPGPAWLAPLFVAPFVGSFLGVLVRGLPAGRPVVFRRSVCESCGCVLDPVALLPVVSYLLQRGRCRQCAARIAPMHLAIELAAIGVTGWATWAVPDTTTLWIGCLLGWTLLALGWIDWENMVLPDVLTLPLLLLGLTATWILAPALLADHLGAAVAGYLAFRALEIGYRKLRGRDGLGQGDAKLLAAAGAWVGLQALPLVVLGGALAGLCAALFMRLRGAHISATTALPFGPGLALALWVVWLYVLPT